MPPKIQTTVLNKLKNAKLKKGITLSKDETFWLLCYIGSLKNLNRIYRKDFKALESLEKKYERLKKRYDNLFVDGREYH